MQSRVELQYLITKWFLFYEAFKGPSRLFHLLCAEANLGPKWTMSKKKYLTSDHPQ